MKKKSNRHKPSGGRLVSKTEATHTKNDKPKLTAQERKELRASKHIVNYKFRLYPNQQEELLLLSAINECRYLYNELLDIKQVAYKEFGVSTNKMDLINYITDIKLDRPKLYDIHSQILQNVAERITYAYQRFFDDTPNRYPRFKSQNQYRSITYPQSGFKLNINEKNFKKSTVKLSSISENVKITLHRLIVGKIKTCTVKHTKSDLWYIFFSVEQTEEQFHKKPKQQGKPVGGDVGISSLLTLSDGTKIPNNKYQQRSAKRLLKAQRELSRKESGSANRAKAKQKFAKKHEQITNQRSDAYFKATNTLCNNYSDIVLEDISSKFMFKSNKHMAKLACDVAWGELFSKLDYQADKFNRQIHKVDPAYTSQLCSRCNTLVPKTLAERMHNCPMCGLTVNRDVNAAVNILKISRLPKSDSDLCNSLSSTSRWAKVQTVPSSLHTPPTKTSKIPPEGRESRSAKTSASTAVDSPPLQQSNQSMPLLQADWTKHKTKDDKKSGSSTL